MNKLCKKQHLNSNIFISSFNYNIALVVKKKNSRCFSVNICIHSSLTMHYATLIITLNLQMLLMYKISIGA